MNQSREEFVEAHSKSGQERCSQSAGIASISCCAACVQVQLSEEDSKTHLKDARHILWWCAKRMLHCPVPVREAGPALMMVPGLRYRDSDRARNRAAPDNGKDLSNASIRSSTQKLWTPGRLSGPAFVVHVKSHFFHAAASPPPPR